MPVSIYSAARADDKTSDDAVRFGDKHDIRRRIIKHLEPVRLLLDRDHPFPRFEEHEIGFFVEPLKKLDEPCRVGNAGFSNLRATGF